MTVNESKKQKKNRQTNDANMSWMMKTQTRHCCRHSRFSYQHV